MRSIAVILVSLLSLAPLYSLSLPTPHDNTAHRTGGFTDNVNCDPALYKKRHVNSGINCAEMGGVGFQLAGTNSLVCMTSEQARRTQSPGICWMAKHSGSGANRRAAFPDDEGHSHSKVDMMKGHRDYRRASVVPAPMSPRPLPSIPAPEDNEDDAQPITQLRPLPKIPGQAPAVNNARPVTRPRPLPVIPGRRVQGPRPKPTIRRY